MQPEVVLCPLKGGVGVETNAKISGYSVQRSMKRELIGELPLGDQVYANAHGGQSCQPFGVAGALRCFSMVFAVVLDADLPFGSEDIDFELSRFCQRAGMLRHIDPTIELDATVSEPAELLG